MQTDKSILIGNSFPLSLIRRAVTIQPQTPTALRNAMRDVHVVSFWGHANTLQLAETFLECGLAPKSERPVLNLSGENLPTLGNQTFSEAWILSPDYIGNFRPAAGEEVSPEKIRGWQILKITWE
jgi:hypothetical protein